MWNEVHGQNARIIIMIIFNNNQDDGPMGPIIRNFLEGN